MSDCFAENALAERPSFADAWNNLGAALKDQGQIEQAVACLDNAVRLQPENAGFHSNWSSASTIAWASPTGSPARGPSLE